MKPELQRIAIAEACGWERCSGGGSCGVWKTPTGINPQNTNEFKILPDYLNDLNAMHDAENTLDKNQEAMYYDRLCAISGVMAYRATAAQRAEAFLKTLNLWKP